jgi:hypothetical protein
MKAAPTPLAAFGPFPSFTAEAQRTQRSAENMDEFLCESRRPLRLCDEDSSVCCGPVADARLMRHFGAGSAMEPLG